MALHSLRQQRETGSIDYEILAFDEAEPPQFIEQREIMRCIARARKQAAEAINASGLLSACRERPHCRAAEQRDELTPFQGSVSRASNRKIPLREAYCTAGFQRRLCPLWVDAVEKGFSGGLLSNIDSRARASTQS